MPPEGQLPDESRVSAIRKWGPCQSLSEVRAFLGTVGVVRIFIKNFSLRAHPLINLTRKDEPIIFGPEQIQAQEDLKTALLESPALRTIDYTSSAPVILAIDTSYIAISFHLCQCDVTTPYCRYYNRFCSITLNDRESKYSQLKLKIYGLYRALYALRLYLIGVQNLVVEVDVRYIKGMLSNPDISPSASINRWIVAILTFHFDLIHVPGMHHGPDGLSRRPQQVGDDEDRDDEEEFTNWIDQLHEFLHQINVVDICLPTTSDSLPLLFPCILTLAQATDLSEEDTTALDTTNSDINDYTLAPWSAQAKVNNSRLLKVFQWLQDLRQLDGLSDTEYATFVWYCTDFFVDGSRLWHKGSHGAHKLVIPLGRQLDIIHITHDSLGHKAFYATKAHISQRFWWPSMVSDVHWYTKTCHICQLHQTRQVPIPPVIATPTPIFTKAYIDTMHMLPARATLLT
jgi:hypothetical protein